MIFENLLLKFAYYAIFPAIFFIGIWLLKKRGEDLKNVKLLRRSEEIKKEKYIKNIESKIKKYEALFLISLLLLSGGWNFIAASYCDYSMHSQLSGSTGAKGPAYANQDPVKNSLGPSRDTDKIISRMEEEPNRWFPKEVKDQIDLEKLTMIPGHLAVYRLINSRYIITYTYASPYPIIKAYGFLIFEEEKNSTDNQSEIQEALLLMKERTIMYPEDPNLAKDFIME